MEGKDRVQLQIVDEDYVTIRYAEFRELVAKAVRLDAIAESVRQKVDAESYSKVDDDVVLLMTGTMNYTRTAAPETEQEG